MNTEALHKHVVIHCIPPTHTCPPTHEHTQASPLLTRHFCCSGLHAFPRAEERPGRAYADVQMERDVRDPSGDPRRPVPVGVTCLLSTADVILAGM